MYSAKFKIFLHICQEIFLVTCQAFEKTGLGGVFSVSRRWITLLVHDHVVVIRHLKSIQTRSRGLGSTFLFREGCQKKTVQGVSKKRYFSDFHLFSVVEVGFHFLTCHMKSDFEPVSSSQLEHAH